MLTQVSVGLHKRRASQGVYARFAVVLLWVDSYTLKVFMYS